jgi:deoxyribonuclease V
VSAILSGVLVRKLHPWDLSPAEAIALQTRLAPQVVREGEPDDVRTVAAVDVAFVDRPAGKRPSLARAAVVLMDYPDLTPLEHHVVERPVTFPYVPGLLSFREIPALADAFAQLEATADLLLVDGQGYSHPRRFGLASHLGLLLDVPTIGCAKSRLCGEHPPPAAERGSTADLRHEGETIGLVLRTRDNVAPVYVSVGHRIGLPQAAEWVLRLCRGYRLPEPIRLADRLSKDG